MRKIPLNLYVLFFTLAIALLLASCQKNVSEPQPDNQPPKPVPDWVIQKFRSTPKKMLFPVDKTKKHEAIVVDDNGRQILPGDENSRLLDMVCHPEGANFFDNEFSFQAETGLIYSCGGYRVFGTIRVATGFTIVSQDPNSSALSRVTVHAKVSGSTVSSTDGPITMGSITFITVNGVGQNVYDVSFVSDVITTPANLNNVSFEYRPYIYTNCVYAAITSPANLVPSSPVNYADACNRIDVVDISSSSGDPTLAYFDGVNAGFCYPSGFTPPQSHEVQWKKVGDATYGSYQSLNFYVTCTPVPGLAHLASSVSQARSFPVTGNLTFRYRNLKKPDTSPCSTAITCSGPWSEEQVVYIYP